MTSCSSGSRIRRGKRKIWSTRVDLVNTLFLFFGREVKAQRIIMIAGKGRKADGRPFHFARFREDLPVRGGLSCHERASLG